MMQMLKEEILSGDMHADEGLELTIGAGLGMRKRAQAWQVRCLVLHDLGHIMVEAAVVTVSASPFGKAYTQLTSVSPFSIL